MLLILGALAGAAALAAYTYLGRERLGAVGSGFAALRWTAIAVLVLLLFDPPWFGSGALPPPVILLDRSLSMAVAGGHWQQARDTATVLAGVSGRVLGFGRTVGPLTDSVPEDGASLLREALAAARADGGPVWVVTDGEIADGAGIPPSLLEGVGVVVLPRDTVPGAALVDVRVPPTVRATDAIPVAVTMASWGHLAADSVRVEIVVDGRRLLARWVGLPQSPATVQRVFAVAARGLAPGDHVVGVDLAAPGDDEARDNARLRTVSVVSLPPVVLIEDPAGWEGRFVFETFEGVSGMPMRGFARIGEGRWVDLATSRAVTAANVRAAAGAAALLVVQGSDDILRGTARRGPVWRWEVDGSEAPPLDGDWYVVAEVPPSPLSRALARVEWDSVPPLTGVHSVPAGAEPAVLLAQQNRRGQARPVVVHTVDGDRRELRTLAEGFARWALRGGASREALRALVASGTDWLLRSSGAAARVPLESDRTVPLNVPVTFWWSSGAAPDSVALSLTSGGETRDTIIRFDAAGRASLPLAPGVYRWNAAAVGAHGTVAVESYSDEFPPAPVVLASAPMGPRAALRAAGRVRDRWWIYLLALLALIGEWAWRQRRGLP